MRTVRFGGLVAAGFGLLALVGWALGLPFLASLAWDRIPMAPSTALLFILYGIATFLGARAPLSRGGQRAGAAIAAGGALLALVLLFSFFEGVRPVAELLGFAAMGPVGGAPVGHMSPVTAMCFLLASASFLGSLPSSASGPWRAAAAWWAACLLLAASSVLLLAYLFGSPLFYGGSFIPPAATTSIAFAALGTALLALAGKQARPSRTAAPLPPRVPYALVVLFVLLAAGIVSVGGFYFRSDAMRYHAEVEHQLSAVAELKASDLAEWRAERLGDASLFQGNAPFSALVERMFEHPPDAEAQAQLRSWLIKAQTHYPYDQVALIDAQGAERLAVPDGRAPASSVIARRVPGILRSGAVAFEDFYRNEHDARVYLSVLAPIVDERSRELGVVALRIDPEGYLYPLLNRWPTPAQSAETLLVRREGDDVLFLNELKFQEHTALTLRIPLTSQDVAAVKAVLGLQEIVEARDYRGVPVIAALRAVPGSPWFLVARMDASEANAPLRERLWVMVALVGGLLAAAAGGVGIVWREQRLRDFRERYEAERERSWLHDVVARSLNEIYVFDPKTLRFSFVNRGACRNLGYTPEELASLTPLDIKPRFMPDAFRAALEPLRNDELPVQTLETIHRRKDGSEYPVEVHLQLVDPGTGAVFLAVVNDITERRRAEARIRHLNRVHAVLSEVNQTIVRVREPQALFAEVCRIAVETGGFRMAWLGLRDATEDGILPVAHAGVTDGYLDKLQIGAAPRTLEPTASALREGRHDVCNDIEHDPRMAPWRDDALARGYRALAAFPLAVGGETTGTFNLYAGEPGFFDEEELGLLDQMAMDLSFAMEMARLEEAGLRLTTAIEQSPVSVVITDADGRITYVNPAFTRITGYPPAEALGGNPRMLKSGKQEPALYQELWATISAGRSWHGELVNRRKDGSLYTQELTIAPVRGAAGRVSHFVAISQDVTERKRAEYARQESELALRDNEQRLRLALSVIDMAVFGQNSDLVYTWMFRPQLGFLPEQVVGRTDAQLLPPEAARQATEIKRRVLETGAAARGEVSVDLPDGTLNYDLAVEPLRDADGQVVGVTGASLNITERKQAERALRSAEALYRALFEQSPDGVVLIDPETGKTIEANEAAHRQLGYTRDEFAALTIADYEAAEAAEETRRRMQRILSQGSHDFETLHRTKNGEIRNVHVWAKTVPLAGRVVFYAIFEDVTDRRRAEAALRASEERYRALFDRNLAAVYRTTLDGRILECNDAFARIFGYASPTEALSADVNTLYPKTAPRRAFVERLKAEGVVVNHEFEGRRKDGGAVWLLENASLVGDDELGGPAIIEGTLLDITERQRLEAQLRQSQKIEAIGQLAGGVAHDFNNILGVITGYGELAQRQLGPDHAVRGRVDQMVKAAERAAALTRQLLAFSRKQVMRPTPLDVNALVGEAHKMLGRLISEDVQVIVRAATGLGTVMADPGQVEQIILNLAVNARDAMPKGGSLMIETANVDLDQDYCAAHPPATPGRYVMLAVSDTGIGMDRETQQRIFEPFFTTKPEGQGTGLGLATVYGIVKQSGGYLWVYSEPGRGTTFKVYLPRTDKPPEGARPRGVPVEGARGRETILLVEDTEALQEVIRETLEERGYTVLLASNGEEALARARECTGPIHLLLTDVVMPKVGGGELAKRLSALRPGIRVLYMSGYTNGAISQHGVLAEGAALLEKPFTGDKLARAVREALDRPARSR